MCSAAGKKYPKTPKCIYLNFPGTVNAFSFSRSLLLLLLYLLYFVVMMTCDCVEEINWEIGLRDRETYVNKELRRKSSIVAETYFKLNIKNAIA